MTLQTQETDYMREAADEFLSWSLATDSQDMLYAVRNMTPEKRQSVLPNIKEAIQLLALCEKEISTSQPSWDSRVNTNQDYLP